MHAFIRVINGEPEMIRMGWILNSVSHCVGVELKVDSRPIYCSCLCFVCIVITGNVQRLAGYHEPRNRQQRR